MCDDAREWASVGIGVEQCCRCDARQRGGEEKEKEHTYTTPLARIKDGPPLLDPERRVGNIRPNMFGKAVVDTRRAGSGGYCGEGQQKREPHGRAVHPHCAGSWARKDLISN